MITKALMKTLWKPAKARAFLYLCEDGSAEILPPEGGEFEVLRCADPLIYPLSGGPLTGKRLSKANDSQG